MVGLDCKSILTPSASQIYAFQRLKVYFLNIFVYVEAWTLEGSWLKHEKGKTYVRCRWHHMRKLKNNETPWDSVLSENLHLCLMGNFCQIEVWHPFNGKRARKVSPIYLHSRQFHQCLISASLFWLIFSGKVWKHPLDHSLRAEQKLTLSLKSKLHLKMSTHKQEMGILQILWQLKLALSFNQIFTVWHFTYISGQKAMFCATKDGMSTWGIRKITR